MKNTKRIISVITALIMVLTMYAVTATAIENAPAYSVVKRTESNQSTYTYTNEEYAAFGNNLIGGNKATVYALSDDLSERTLVTELNDHANQLAMLTDSAIEDPGTGASRAQLYYPGGIALPKVDLEYDLGGNCAIDKFTLISMQNTKDFSYYSKFYTGKYEVYLSDSVADLYNSENLIYSYDYTTESERAGAQIVSFNEAVTGKYLAVRILETLSLTGEETGKAYPRIAEIGLFGSEVYTETLRSESNYSSYTYTNDQYVAFGNNLISGSKATVYSLSENLTDRTLVTNLNDADNQLGMLTDSAVEDAGTGASRAQIYIANGSLSKADLEYDLGTTCTIDKFALISMQNTRDFSYYSKFYAGKYEVYLSDSLNDLYDAENMVYSYDYTTVRERSGAQIVDFDKAVSGRYLAVRILDPLSLLDTETSTPRIRIAEIGVFGTADYTVQYRTESNYTTTGYTNDAYAALGTNLLSGKLAETYVPAEDGRSHSAVTNLDNAATKLAMLTDGAVEDPGTGASRAQLFITGGGVLPKLDLEYDLGTTCTVDKFALISMQNTRDFNYYAKFYTGKYEVYMSDDVADLYNTENLIFTYDYSDVAERSGAQVVTFNKKATGRYFAVRILDPLSLIGDETASAYARIAEIGLFGVADGDVNEDGNADILDAVLLDAHLDNNSFAVANGDVDGSGVVDAADLSALRAILLKK